MLRNLVLCKTKMFDSEFYDFYAPLIGRLETIQASHFIGVILATFMTYKTLHSVR